MQHAEPIEVLIAVVVALAALAGLSVSTGPVHAEETVMLDWFDDYDAAIAEAKRTGKPIFLEFRCAP